MPPTQADTSEVGVKKRVVVRASSSLRQRGGAKGELVAPLQQSLSSLQVMDTLTTH